MDLACGPEARERCRLDKHRVVGLHTLGQEQRIASGIDRDLREDVVGESLRACAGPEEEKVTVLLGEAGTPVGSFGHHPKGQE